MEHKLTVPIETTAFLFCRSMSETHYIRQIFLTLRDNMELLEDPDYKRLYDEALDYWVKDLENKCILRKNNRKNNYENVELTADIFVDASKRNNEKLFSIDEVNTFLDARRQVWDK